MLRRIEIFTDVLLTALVFVGVSFLQRNLPIGNLGEQIPTSNYTFLPLMILLIWYVILDRVDRKYGYGVKMTSIMILEIWKGVTISTVILVSCIFLFKVKDIGRWFIFTFYIADLLVLILARLLIYQFISSKRHNKYFQRHILIIGSRTAARELIQLVSKHNDMGIEIVGCIEMSKEDVGKTVACGVQIIGTLDDLRDFLPNRGIDEVLITMPLNEISNSEWYLSFINSCGITVRIIPYWYIRKFMTIHASHSFKVEHFLSEPALIVSRIQSNQDALAVKSTIDYMIATLVLIVTSPLFLILPVLIKSCSIGPVFYKQIRSGQDGREFILYKFRSMVLGAEEQQYTLIEINESDGPAFKIKKDPRIIPYIGTFMRKFGLDEIPQFINVIRGEMSVVGPRPPTPFEVKKYEMWQRRRLSMKPGLTCIWQVQPGRNDITFEQWMNMDMEYIDRWSLWMDFIILLKTIPAVLSGHGR